MTRVSRYWRAVVSFALPALGLLSSCGGSDDGSVGTGITVSIHPPVASVPTGMKQEFVATVTETPDTMVVWSVEGGWTYGTISPLGSYTAPAEVPESGVALIRATSVANRSKSAIATVMVTAYPAPSSPENLIEILRRSFERRDTGTYVALLGPEYTFWFQQPDIPPGLDREYWMRGEDSTGTGALFASSEVSAIRVDPGDFVVEDAGRIDAPGAQRIRLSGAKLEVDTSYGITWVAGDTEDFYFRRGRAVAWEDTTRWYLFEWRDLRGIGPNGAVPPQESSSSIHMKGAGNMHAPASMLPTWGMLKQMYR